MRPHHLWLAIALSISSPAFGASGSLETITTSEFLKLPEDLQNVYVAGVLDGMSYVTYNYEIADHDKFVACVRTQSLAATVAGVLDYIKNNPDDAKNPLPWSVTKAIGKFTVECQLSFLQPRAPLANALTKFYQADARCQDDNDRDAVPHVERI